jgi:aerotaxis receptor
MRNNGPVTGKEVTYPDDAEIVSGTDSRGIITFCNENFCRIAGFERDELINKPHNILRHQDMPAAAFEMLWVRIKSGKAWKGIVKNRCKNGDHYWVDAYVTPLRDDGGEITGYESVRVKPDAQVVARAEMTYQRINKGQSIFPAGLIWRQRVGAQLPVWLALFALLMVSAGVASALSVAVLVASLCISTVLAFVSYLVHEKSLKQTLANARSDVHDPLAAYIYTGRVDSLGEIQFTRLMNKSRLRAALGRFSESAKELRSRAEQVKEQANCSRNGMNAQQQETQKVAIAMQQMSLAVQEVAAGVTEVSGATGETLEQVTNGTQVLAEASGAIDSLSDKVSNLGQIVDRLSADSAEISSVVDVIRGIAEQTNLLALNAAIEAARAGEQGRGFAVVADEVRTLAQRTQESTGDIQSIIEKLSSATHDAANSMTSCQELAERSVSEMSNVDNALGSISESVSSIDQMSHRIASAAEEQSASAIEIESNTQAISDISNRTQEEAVAAADLSQEMTELAEKQFQLVERFQ